jgi:hypothetical protein
MSPGLSRATALLTASRCPAAWCTTPAADGVEHCLGTPGLATRIVKSKRHVAAVGDLDATERCCRSDDVGRALSRMTRLRSSRPFAPEPALGI